MIKLYRSGVLAKVVVAFPCAIPQAVYREVVTRGRARLHQDAEAIEAIIGGIVTVEVTPERQQPEMGLGAGEIGILDMLDPSRSQVVVSDDRRFLNLLTTQGISFLTPADVLVAMAGRGTISGPEADEALERLRPLIRRAAYEEAREDLKHGGKS